MTQDEIIRFAIQCRLVTTGNCDGLYMDALTEFAKLVATKEREALAQPEQEPVAWPCLIAEADFSQDTVTLTMQCTDYKVSAGKHWLSTNPPQRTEQEPVALETLLKWDDDIDDIDPIGEVVGFIEGSPYIMVKVHKGKQVSLDDDLYATPPQRTEQCNYPDCKCPTENPCLKKLAQPEQEPLKIFQYNCTCGRTMKFESVHGVVAPQRTEQNFCSRCGKRVGGIDSIHTCTPPMEMNT